MSDLLSSQRENAELRARNLALERRVSDTEAALAAVARGEVDAVAIAASASPILLHAAQARLRSSQQLLRAVFDSSTDAIMLADDHGVYIDANPAALSLLALARDEVIGQRFTAFVVTEADSEAGLKHFLPHGSLAGQLTIRRSDGTLRIVDYSAVANVTPGVHLSVLRDVTERELAEEALRASRDQLEEAQAIAHVGSWTSDVSPDGKIEWSSECYRIYGIPEGTPMTVAAFFAHVHPDDRERMHLTTRAALDQGAPAEIEHRIVRCDGQVRRVQQRGVVERDATGLAIRMFGTLQDVTDRVAAPRGGRGRKGRGAPGGGGAGGRPGADRRSAREPPRGGAGGGRRGAPGRPAGGGGGGGGRGGGGGGRAGGAGAGGGGGAGPGAARGGSDRRGRGGAGGATRPGRAGRGRGAGPPRRRRRWTKKKAEDRPSEKRGKQGGRGGAGAGRRGGRGPGAGGGGGGPPGAGKKGRISGPTSPRSWSPPTMRSRAPPSTARSRAGTAVPRTSICIPRPR
ncbi:MAG: PAS domain S-box protein [Myxococcales bacterium]|nr:PAS domain S-box protein [Myxococcales bacterium]